MNSFEKNEEKIARQKQSIREQMLRMREQLTPDQLRQASVDVSRQLEKLLKSLYPEGQPKPLHIALYAAIKNELNLSNAWPMLQKWPAYLYFPAVEKDKIVLGAIPPGVNPSSVLLPGRFGIPEPPRDNRLGAIPLLDLILVPGLAFDLSGNRLGWGKGYYDKWLALLPPETMRIGVGYSFQVLKHLPAEKHDQRLDLVLTPAGWCFLKDKEERI